jgi:uncharacterized protein (TIGR00297 family)
MYLLGTVSEIELLVGGILIIGLGAVAIKWRAIDLLGAFSGGIISLLAFLAGGFSWLLMIVIFFGVSSAFTKYRYDYKRTLGFAQDKSGTRSWPNSLANGGVAAIASVGDLYTHSEIFAVMFLTSVVTALSDTLATEIGLLSHSRPRMITRISKLVEPGTSGGITFLGNVAALLSASGLSVLGAAVSVFQDTGPSVTASAILAVIIGAIIGVFFDSLLGATVQGVNKCAVCGKTTENLVHHDQKTVTVRGLRIIDNNVVNFVGILVGALASIGIFLLLLAL